MTFNIQLAKKVISIDFLASILTDYFLVLIKTESL